MRSISALSGSRPRISAFAARPRGTPSAVSILCLYTCRFTVSAWVFSGLYGAGSHANHSHTGGARILSVSTRKLCLLSEKYFSLSENGQCRTIHKRKANNRPANCRSLANRQSAGIQREMIKTNRGRGLESNARPPVADKPCRDDSLRRPQMPTLWQKHRPAVRAVSDMLRLLHRQIAATSLCPRYTRCTQWQVILFRSGKNGTPTHSPQNQQRRQYLPRY